MRILGSLFLFVCLFHCLQAGNILLWISAATKSHTIIWKPLVQALSARGHQITFVTPFEDRELQSLENMNYIVVKRGDMTGFMNSTNVFNGRYLIDIFNLMKIFTEGVESSYKLPAIQKLIKEKPKFDVSIISAINIDLGLFLAKKHFDSPVILFNPVLRNSILDLAVGNPVNPAYIPVEMFDYSQEMSFLQRVANTLILTFAELWHSYHMVPKVNAKIQEVLNLDYTPDLAELYKNADFVFFNSHPIFDDVRPLNPNTARIGGTHLHPAKPLQGELKEWLDDAKDGAILVSFGSVLSSSDLPVVKKNIMVNTFSKLKERIIWKWETEDMEGKPDNVMIKKWLPQQDILGHPNVKLFITHGGLMSTEESLYYGVPILVMPGFGDQFSNGARAKRAGYGAVLQWTELEEDKFLSTIQSLIHNDTVQTTAVYYGDLLRDNAINSLDLAVYHTEYIMRHKGAAHLKSPVKKLYWFQYFLLDVFLFLFATTTVTLYIAYKLTILTVKHFCCHNKGDIKVKQN